MAENKRRDVPRDAVSCTAVIHLKGKDHLCIVTNRSPNGYRLKVGPDLPPVATYPLKLPGEVETTVTVMWRSGEWLGVRKGRPSPLRWLSLLGGRLGLIH